MKNKLKKLAATALVSAVAFTGFSSISPTKADAASACYDNQNADTLIGSYYNVCGTDYGTSVYGAISKDITHPGNGTVTYWKMLLQRETTTIAERTGYVSYSSSSDREFTNVMKVGARTRIVVYYYSDSTRKNLIDVVWTPYWIR